MKEWYSVPEIAPLSLPGLPSTPSAVTRFAIREGWRDRINLAGEPLARKRAGRGGGWEYHYHLFPTLAQARLKADHKVAEPEPSAAPGAEPTREDAWAFFAHASARQKEEAERKLGVLKEVEEDIRGGMSKEVAVTIAARDAGVSKGSVYNWLRQVAGKNRQDWLPYLVPQHYGRPREKVCHPDAWEMLKADFLRAERPTFQSCFRRMARAAKAHGWDHPSERTLQRRMDTEIADPIRISARYGKERLKELYPPQERDRSVFHAMEAINADGHRWDVWVEWPDGEVLRPCMTAIQDVYSGLFLSWRVDKSENQEAFRLAFGDMVEDFGIPDVAYLDNGRNFASKWLTGGTSNRYRFTVRADEPVGILTSLGVDIHWTTPYSGQSKPIERGFRDFCDNIAKHPALHGAWTGNTPLNKPENYRSRAVKLDDFLGVVADGIAEHNTRPGRRAMVCKGRSFAETFRESYANAAIRKATGEQRRLWLLAAEGIRASSRDGTLRLLGNRYWADFLHGFMGEKLVVRFDPQDLSSGVHVYRLSGVYLGFAPVIEATGFNDVTAAREHGRARRRYMKGVRQQLEAVRTLSPEEVAARIPEIADAPDVDAKIVRMVAADPAIMRPEPVKIEEKATFTEDEEAVIAEGWQTMSGEENGNVTPLPVAPKSDAPPRFETDADFVIWVRAHPEAASPGQTLYATELFENNTSIRMLVEEEESRRSEEATA